MERSKDDEVVFLSLEQIEAIHTDQLALYGGREGYRNKHLIESAVSAPTQTMFGRPLYKDVADIASVYLYQISESQGFTDGNKRTGAAACVVFLLVNGYELDCNDTELYNMAIWVAKGQMTREDVAAWIRRRILPVA